MTEVISGVRVRRLTVHADARGRLMEIMRPDWEEFEKFGQVYMTTVYPGVVKAWHLHRLQRDNFTCVKGMIRLALFDDREGSPTRGKVNEFFLGEHSPLMVSIPPEVQHGFQCVGDHEAIVVNCPTEMYKYEEPDEHRLDPHDNSIPFDWHRRDG